MRRVSWTVIILLILTSGYSALWFAAYSKIQSSIHVWRAAEQDAGRVWTCEKESIGGFPLQMIFTCEQPSFEDFGARSVRLAASFLQLEAHILNPKRIGFSFREHFSVALQLQSVNLSFERLDGFMSWGPSSSWELHIGGQDFLLSSERDGLLPVWTGSTLGSMALRFSEPGADASPRTLNFAVDIKDARPAAQNVLTLNNHAVDGKIVGRITHSAIVETSAFAQLERWRTNGGLLILTEADVSSNGSGIGVSGTFRLDELRRIAGKGNVGFSDGLILTNAMKSLSGRNFTFGLGAPRPSNAVGPRPLQAPINFKDGKVYVGPVNTRLRTYPLY